MSSLQILIWSAFVLPVDTDDFQLKTIFKTCRDATTHSRRWCRNEEMANRIVLECEFPHLTPRFDKYLVNFWPICYKPPKTYPCSGEWRNPSVLYSRFNLTIAGLAHSLSEQNEYQHPASGSCGIVKSSHREDRSGGKSSMPFQFERRWEALGQFLNPNFQATQFILLDRWQIVIDFKACNWRWLWKFNRPDYSANSDSTLLWQDFGA